jgi:hypothetical protein
MEYEKKSMKLRPGSPTFTSFVGTWAGSLNLLSLLAVNKWGEQYLCYNVVGEV